LLFRKRILELRLQLELRDILRLLIQAGTNVTRFSSSSLRTNYPLDAVLAAFRSVFEPVDGGRAVDQTVDVIEGRSELGQPGAPEQESLRPMCGKVK
jgi:hypothetical protein